MIFISSPPINFRFVFTNGNKIKKQFFQIDSQFIQFPFYKITDVRDVDQIANDSDTYFMPTGTRRQFFSNWISFENW